jgi:L-alanine-DL-glutamate epimerase-like enolase superfamily enzyme
MYRLLGGYRNRIQTSITVPLSTLEESLDYALYFASQGFRILKVKGGENPEDDVRRIRAIHQALPELTLRLDADGGYLLQEAIDVARALKDHIETFEQPTPPDDLHALRQITKHSPLPVLVDQSISGAKSALEIAANYAANGMCIKLACCGGLAQARQVDAIARAAQLSTMVSCLIEPALLTAAGLSFALSSPNIRYGDLDGFLHINNDPSKPGFILKDGWLIATDVPGLGYTVDID